VGYEVRKTGDGFFYLVSVDESGDSTALYSEEKLVRYSSSTEAKEAIKDLGASGRPVIKKRRLI